MITITPQGSVYLCKTPLENDYQHQLTFESATAQLTYFNSKIAFTCNDVTYVKKDNQIVVDYPIDTIITCNYLFYKNTGFTTKYYYCFITNMEYVNENATRITFETDVYQTYMFDITFKKSFVEREHVNDDTIGKHTVREGLQTGEFIVNAYEDLDYFVNEYQIVCATAKLPKKIEEDLVLTSQTVPTKSYNDIYSGLFYLVFQTYDDLTKFLITMDGQGIIDYVYSVFIVPNDLVPTVTYITKNEEFTVLWRDITVSGTWDITFALIPSTTGATNLENAYIDINTTLNGYVPKNNKMFTNEFNYMYVSNNAGEHVQYNYEDFYENTPLFRVEGALTPGCSIRLIPQNYKLFQQIPPNEANTQDDTNCLNSWGMTGAKLPVCSWGSDSYTNWLTTQGANAPMNFFGGLIKSGVGALMELEGLVDIGFNEASNSFDIMLDRGEMHDKTPGQAHGNINSGDVTFSMGKSLFTIYKMSVRYEFAEKIDNYLSVYGYRVNSFKVPNLTGRTYWNFVKTRNCNLEGDIPQEYINKLKEIFNKGVTLWHDTTKFLDYSQNNTIVTPTP